MEGGFFTYLKKINGINNIYINNKKTKKKGKKAKAKVKLKEEKQKRNLKKRLQIMVSSIVIIILATFTISDMAGFSACYGATAIPSRWNKCKSEITHIFTQHKV